MTVKQLSLYLNNEDESEVYLLREGILKSFDKCIKCSSSHLGRVRRGKIMCYECRTEWNMRKGSIIESKKISLGSFIGIIKLFADGVNAATCSRELEIGTKLTRSFYKILRLKIFKNESLKISDMHKVNFVIKDVNGQININEGKNIESENSIAELTATRTKDNQGIYLFNFSYKSRLNKNFLRRIERIDKLDNFYRYCQQYLLSFRGRDMNSLAAALQELAFRYNHRKEDMFTLLVTKIIN